MRALIVCLSLIIFGCHKGGLPAPAGGGAGTPARANLKRAVELTQARQRTIVAAVDQVGTLEAKQTAMIPAGVSGIVEKVGFAEGMTVSPEDTEPLAVIDADRYKALLESAESAVDKSDKLFEAANDYYQRSINPNTSFSEEEKIKAKAAMQAARADQATARAALKVAKFNDGRCRVKAPFRGQVNEKRIALGTYVKEEAIVATIADLSEIRLVGYVPESASAMIRMRMEQRQQIVAARSIAAMLAGADGGWGGFATQMIAVKRQIPSGYDPEFTVPSLPKRSFRAEMFFMATVADPTTHMFETKSLVDPRDRDFAKLKPGYTARIKFPYESTEDAVVVPEEAVRATERGWLVFVVKKVKAKDGSEDWIAKSIRVEVGARTPGWVEVRSGLAEGQWIVRRGAETLDDGVPVRIPEEQLKQMK
jgi:multidrug efflux system membrane fusion protein